MVKTKGIEATRRKWEESHGRVQKAYQEGVQGASGWQENAVAAEDLYAQKMQEAIAARSRAKGVQAVSNEQWRSAAIQKGAARIGQGMAAAKDKFASKMGEVLSVIESVSLPPKTADPMANIDNRVKPIADALHRHKMGR